MSYPRLLAACVWMGALAQTPPAPVAEYANLGFAWRLHQELARSGPNENLVLSPLSLQSVLAVVAEGARGKTAAELGTCLGLPASARRSGDEERPWDFTVLHQANRAAVAALRAPWAAPDQVEHDDSPQGFEPQQPRADSVVCDTRDGRWGRGRGGIARWLNGRNAARSNDVG